MAKCLAAYTDPDLPPEARMVGFVNISRENEDEVSIHVRDRDGAQASIRLKNWQWQELLSDLFKAHLNGVL